MACTKQLAQIPYCVERSRKYKNTVTFIHPDQHTPRPTSRHQPKSSAFQTVPEAIRNLQSKYQHSFSVIVDPASDRPGITVLDAIQARGGDDYFSAYKFPKDIPAQTLIDRMFDVTKLQHSDQVVHYVPLHSLKLMPSKQHKNIDNHRAEMYIWNSATILLHHDKANAYTYTGHQPLWINMDYEVEEGSSTYLSILRNFPPAHGNIPLYPNIKVPVVFVINKKKKQSSSSTILSSKTFQSSIKLLASFYIFSTLQRHTSQYLLRILRTMNPFTAYGAVLSAHSLYIGVCLELLLFQPKETHQRYIPQLYKMFRRIGIEDFVLNDQRRTCDLSHPGSSCTDNTLQLWWKWWKNMLPAYCLTKLCYHVLLSRRSWRSFDFRLCLKQLMFLFSSSGLCGGLFCLCKQKWSVDGKGGRDSVVISSVAGAACALMMLPMRSSVRLVVSMYCGSVIGVGWSMWGRWMR